MKIYNQVHSTYQQLEHIHHKYGLILHGSVFLFSLLLGISLGLIVLFINVTTVKRQTEQMKIYENQVMSKLVKKIEAAPPKYK